MDKEPKKFNRKTWKSGGSVMSTIPKEVVQLLNITAGDDIRFIITADGTVELEKVNSQA